MKKVISVTLSLLLFVTMFTFCVSAADKKSGDYEYSILKDGTVKITKYVGDDEVVSIPEKIKGKKVTVIGKKAFLYNLSLKEVSIPKTIRTIGACSFQYNENLEKLTIANGVKTILHDAFDSCVNLKEVTVPNSVTTVGSGIFFGCKKLSKITLSKNITDMGQGIVGRTAFSLNDNNWENGILYLGKYIINTSRNDLPKDVVIKEGTVLIAENAFEATDMETVKFPKSLKYVCDCAFETCYSLKKVEMNDSLKYIGAFAFYDCLLLNQVEIPASVKKIKGASFGYYFNTDEQKILMLKDFSITGYANTAAEEYAEKRDITFNCQKPKTPKAKITKKGKKIRVKCSNLVGADGIQVRYTVGKKTYTKTYNSKLTSTKTLSNLKKGKYKVKVRAFANQNGKKLYSKWTKVKTVKVK